MHKFWAVAISFSIFTGQVSAENCHCGGVVFGLDGPIFAEDPLVEPHEDYISAFSETDVWRASDGGCDIWNSYPDDEVSAPIYEESNRQLYKKLRWTNVDGSTEWLTMTEASEKALMVCQKQWPPVVPIS